MLAPGSPTLLAIFPIGIDPAAKSKLDIIRNVAASRNWEFQLPAYDSSFPRFEPKKFSSMLESASLVLADLTHERPSCYFELGYAEALDVEVRLIAETGTVIHQTSHKSNVAWYDSLTDLEMQIERLLTG